HSSAPAQLRRPRSAPKLTWLLLRSGYFGVVTRALGAALIAWSVVSLGALVDRRSWAGALECVRLAALALAAALAPAPPLAHGAVVVLACASALWLSRTGQKALPLVPGVS